MYKRDVIRLDRQDDNAAYKVFCSKNLKQLLDEKRDLPFEQREFICLSLHLQITQNILI